MRSLLIYQLEVFLPGDDLPNPLCFVLCIQINAFIQSRGVCSIGGSTGTVGFKYVKAVRWPPSEWQVRT